MSVPLITLNNGNKIPALGLGQSAPSSPYLCMERADHPNLGLLGIFVGPIQVLGNSSLPLRASIPLHTRSRTGKNTSIALGEDHCLLLGPIGKGS